MRPAYPAWVAIAEELYDNLSATTRQLVDRRIEELLEDPTGNPHTKYDAQFDQWSVPIGTGAGRGCRQCGLIIGG
jgi:hypothetical protein